jgi:tetratricopeptide (TPR) repeat protein
MDRMMTKAILAAAALLAGAGVLAQEVPSAPPRPAAEIRELFEAGQYQQVIEAAGPDAEPAILYAAVLSYQKLGAADQASAMAARLAALPPENGWHFVGLSAGQLSSNQIDEALASAESAVTIAGTLPQAHHQRGLVLARRQAWSEAALAFDREAELGPMEAYAFYYGGLAHYRANRSDLMAVRFERFLKLAPKAPERPEVMQIMRTIRGR